MTKDEILIMALSVVPDEDQEDAQGFEILRLTYSEIERFAALVAEKEREECAKEAESWGNHAAAAEIRARGQK